MELGWGGYGLAFVAGFLSILSPCVLPLVPIVVGTAIAAHRLGAVALGAGLAVSFTAIGMFVATVGFAIGLDADWFRAVAAVLLMALGAVLLSGWLQQRFASATMPLEAMGARWLQRVRVEGLGGQLVVGLLLGLVWAPCVGPTLGAAATLASQGRDLGQVAVLMTIFGIGAGLPLVIIGTLSRRRFAASSQSLMRAGARGKSLLGLLMVLLGGAILLGWGKAIEAWLVDISPAWLTALTTRF